MKLYLEYGRYIVFAGEGNQLLAGLGVIICHRVFFAKEKGQKGRYDRLTIYRHCLYSFCVVIYFPSCDFFWAIERRKEKEIVKSYKVFLTKSQKVAELIASDYGAKEIGIIRVSHGLACQDKRVPEIYHWDGYYCCVVEYYSETPKYDLIID